MQKVIHRLTANMLKDTIDMWLITFAILAVIVCYGIMWLNDHQDEQ